jgi:hypothetical protein
VAPRRIHSLFSGKVIDFSDQVIYNETVEISDI